LQPVIEINSPLAPRIDVSSSSGLAIAASAALAFAGLYQFSNLKEACLKKCRNPFAVLFSNWSNRPARVFALGLRQGIWCLGCCWALMLVMFAVGVMNVFWMALIALVALAERQLQGRVVARVSGAILLVWSGGLLLVSV
jgi:predicted metal-binding membrane protein